MDEEMSPDIREALESACSAGGDRMLLYTKVKRNPISPQSLRLWLIVFLQEIPDYLSVRELLEDLLDGLHQEE